MTLTDADLDRIEAVLRDDHAKGYSYANLLLDDAQPLVAEVRRLRAAQTTTLVVCSRCGHGQRARHMVALGDERLCVECAGVAMRKLAQAVIVAYDDLEQRNETDAVHALDDVYDIALHAADAPSADGEVE